MNEHPATTPERIFELATILLARSKEGRVVWTEGPSSRYYTELAGYYAEIESEDGDGRHPYRLAIQEEDGTDIAAISTRISPFDDEPPRGDWPDVLAELYLEAHRRGSKVERALDEMLQAARQSGDEDIEF